MAITPRVREQMFQRAAAGATTTRSRTLIRIPLSRQQLITPIDPADTLPTAQLARASAFGSAWTPTEHERFLGGLELFPSGPWKRVAAFVGTKTARQTMTHAQKYRQKIERRRRALEQQARETQSTVNGTTTDGTTAQSPFSAVTEAPAIEASVPPANSEDLCVEREPKPIVLPVLDLAAALDFFIKDFNDSGDFNHQLFQQLMRDADNLVGQQLLHESVLLLGGAATSGPFSFLPWSLDEPFAFEDTDIDSLVSDDGGSTMEFAFVSDELTRVSHEDIQIWFGESESQRWSLTGRSSNA